MNFLIKKFSPSILIISILIFIYTFYKSEIYWDGKRNEYYLIYYLISLILIFFSIITFYLNQKVKQYLIITSLSLIVSLYFFEAYLVFQKQLLEEQLLEDQIVKEKFYQGQTIKWDRRSRFEIYKDLKKKNDNVVVKVSPRQYIDSDYSIFPLAGVSNSQTIYCNENGYYQIYQSDRYGFNNPNKEWDKDQIDYLIIGDSFVHGACVNRPNDISSVLRSLSNKGVLNLGYSSNGPLIEYATLREYFKKNIKKVLWIYYEGNDLVDLISEKRNSILVNYLNDLNFSQNLKFRQKEIDDLIKKKIEIKEKIEIKDKIDQQKFRVKIIQFVKFSNIRSSITRKPESEFKKILQLTNDQIKKNNSKLYFVYLPEYKRYKTNFINKNYNLIKETVSELGIPFIDIHSDAFNKEKNPLKFFPFEQFGHYNVEGYKKVAETIYKFTKD